MKAENKQEYVLGHILAVAENLEKKIEKIRWSSTISRKHFDGMMLTPEKQLPLLLQDYNNLLRTAKDKLIAVTSAENKMSELMDLLDARLRIPNAEALDLFCSGFYKNKN